jgi:hypothetical protein
MSTKILPGLSQLKMKQENPGIAFENDVPADFSKWSPRSDENRHPSGFIEIHIEATAEIFKRVDGAIDLGTL